jgi:tetratricopeptide (TPR) repeat protein
MSKLSLSLSQVSYGFLLAALLSLPASRAAALGSKEQTPAEEAAASEKKAIGEYNDGVKQMEHARTVAAKGDSVYAYNYRATSDAKARKAFEKAVENFQSAIKLKPDMPEAYNNLGYCWRKLGNFDESLKAYATAIKLKDDFAQAREYRGETYLAIGQLENAQAEKEMLTKLKSPLADTLGKSIELYQLEKIQQKASGK